jgi:hypothetical protein
MHHVMQLAACQKQHKESKANNQFEIQIFAGEATKKED